MNPIKLVVYVGSLREKSFNKMLARAMKENAPEGVEVTIGDFSQLPFYNGDLEAAFPAEAKRLKDEIRAADGVAIVTPEYNRSVPGYLKNMIDWTSRPYGDSAWDNKPVILLGASTGNIGTAVAQAHLRQMMVYLAARVVGQPEFYMGQAKSKFSDDGVLTDEETKKHLVEMMSHFAVEIRARA